MKMDKHRHGVSLTKNAFTDGGEGLITFPNGQIITDDSQQRNGTKYDIESLDLSEYKGQVTADHMDMLHSVIGKVTGVAKRANAVVIDGIQFAIKENALAKMAYDLMRGGFPLDLSIETYGPWPDESDDTYYKAKLIGLSVVVVGNNRSATMAEIARNSLAEARQNGLDTTEAEKVLPEVEEPAEAPEGEQEAEDAKAENDRRTVVPQPVEPPEQAGETDTNPNEDKQVSEVKEDTKVEEVKQDNPAPALDENKLSEMISNGIAAAMKAEREAAEEKAKNEFDTAAKEPEFHRVGNGFRRAGAATNSTKLSDMDWKDRTALQLQSLVASFKGDSDAAQLARSINAVNFEELQREGIVSNALDLPDMGNFVIPKEMVREIKEQPSNYRPLLDVFGFNETNSLETAWLKGTGEIEMSDVDMDDNDDNEDLKPISTPTFATDSSRLYEFAAVTPVKASAIRFAAADLVGHITRLYRRAYDRRLAQSVIGRLEKAVEGNGNSIPYDYSSAAGGDVEAVITLLTAWSEIAEHSPNAYYIMTEASRLHLIAMAMRAGTNGPLANLFTQTPDGVRFLSKPYIIVPGDLLPNLNTAATKTWSFEDVSSVTVNHGVLLADPTDFVGKVSGGLNFQVSDVAPYEENGTVKSAYQRDELVFRGYGYRASGLYFEENVAGVLAPGVS